MTNQTPADGWDSQSSDVAPLFEASISALGGDIDAAGSRLVVWPDRVELRDDKDRIRAAIAIDAIDQVEVRKRLTSARITVAGAGGEVLALKGVKAASATRFRDTLRKLDELARMGLLTDKEVAEKRSELAQRPVRRR